MEKLEPFLTPLLIAFAVVVLYRRYKDRMNKKKDQQGTGSGNTGGSPDDHYEPYSGRQ
jgi:hypothetical protein